MLGIEPPGQLRARQASSLLCYHSDPRGNFSSFPNLMPPGSTWTHRVPIPAAPWALLCRPLLPHSDPPLLSLVNAAFTGVCSPHPIVGGTVSGQRARDKGVPRPGHPVSCCHPSPYPCKDESGGVTSCKNKVAGMWVSTAPWCLRWGWQEQPQETLQTETLSGVLGVQFSSGRSSPRVSCPTFDP